MMKRKKVTEFTIALIGMVMFFQVAKQLLLVTGRQVEQGVEFSYFCGSNGKTVLIIAIAPIFGHGRTNVITLYNQVANLIKVCFNGYFDAIGVY